MREFIDFSVNSGNDVGHSHANRNEKLFAIAFDCFSLYLSICVDLNVWLYKEVINANARNHVCLLRSVVVCALCWCHMHQGLWMKLQFFSRSLSLSAISAFKVVFWFTVRFCLPAVFSALEGISIPHRCILSIEMQLSQGECQFKCSCMIII